MRYKVGISHYRKLKPEEIVDTYAENIASANATVMGLVGLVISQYMFQEKNEDEEEVRCM